MSESWMDRVAATVRAWQDDRSLSDFDFAESMRDLAHEMAPDAEATRLIRELERYVHIEIVSGRVVRAEAYPGHGILRKAEGPLLEALQALAEAVKE